jgi:hypothetical protein
MYGEDTLILIEMDKGYIYNVVYTDIKNINLDCMIHQGYHTLSSKRIEGTALWINLVRGIFMMFVKFCNKYNETHF